MVPDLGYHLRNVVSKGLSSSRRQKRRFNNGDNNITDSTESNIYRDGPPSYNEVPPLETPSQTNGNPITEKFNAYWKNTFHRGYDFHSYIGLGARISQVWLNQWTLILILILVKVLFYKHSLFFALSSAEKQSLSACESTQDIISEAISSPHYAASGANELISLGVEHSISALIKTLSLVISGVENLIIFSLEMIFGTYACLITAAINSSAGTAINATESVIDFVNDGLGGITHEIEDGVDGLSKVINGAGDAVEDVANLFSGGKTEIKDVNISVKKLKNFKIPDSVNEKLSELRNNLPTYKEVKNSTEGLIREPFNLLKNDLNSALSDKSKFNSKALTIPPKYTASFCTDNGGIRKFYTELNHVVGITVKIFVILLIVSAILACAPVVYQEIRNWRWMRACVDRDQPDEIGASSPELSKKIAMVHDATNRGITVVQDVTIKPLKTQEERILARWWVDYMFYTPALSTLLLALCGFLVVTIQYIILHQVKKSLPKFKEEVEFITGEIVGTVKNEGEKWSSNTNRELRKTESGINEDIFGWVRTASNSVNDTFNAFNSKMNKTLHDDFEGTPLYDPISKVMYCVIGSKIEQVEKGLTWIHDHAKITLPRVNDTLLTSSDRGLNPEKAAATTGNVMINALKALIEAYEKSLHLELYISVVLFCAWVLVALIGLAYCLYTRRTLIQDGVLPAYTNSKPSPKTPINTNSMTHPEIQQGIAFPGFQTVTENSEKKSYTEELHQSNRKATPFNEWPQGEAIRPPRSLMSFNTSTPNSPREKDQSDISLPLRPPDEEVQIRGVQKPVAIMVEPPPQAIRKSTKVLTTY